MEKIILKNKAWYAVWNKKGSSMVMLAIIFVGFAICIAGAIGVSRRLVVSSECEAFGRLWTKAVLSEYDRHLLDDYFIMAYFGNDSEVTDKVNAYLNYSAQGKLNASIEGANADLTGYELGNPSNFRKALEKGFAGRAVSEIVSGKGRKYRGEQEDDTASEGVTIRNNVVLDTLPSHGVGGSVSGDDLTGKAKEIGNDDGVRAMLSSAGSEMLLIEKCMNNHVSIVDDKKHLFVNEWEYIIKGSKSDADNHEACRKRLFVARNALNLISLYKDPEKVELIISAAETITPGPLGAATQVVLAEVWAAVETESDLKTLYSYGRVPVIKTPQQWKTGFSSILDSDDLKGKLDEESEKMLDEKRSELEGLSERADTAEQLKEGLNYDEYLMLMIMSLDRSTRLLRIMDLIQINMKYRYYRDFNMMEYYTGIRFTIDADGRSHEFENAYK